MSVSVVILTYNEEKNILDCIESVMGLGEIIIIDDFSQDRTEEIVKNLEKPHTKFYKRRLDDDFSEQRNYGVKQAKSDWLLFLDADERVTPELKLEILKKIQNADSNQYGFFIKRHDFMWGKQLKHGECGNIKFVRLAKKNAGKWRGRVHETWDIKGEIGELKNSIIHFPHPSISEFIKEIDGYSTIRAKELMQKGTTVKFWEIIAYPKAKFVLNYFLKLGFLDGTPGFVVAVLMSFHSFLVRAKLWVLINKS